MMVIPAMKEARRLASELYARVLPARYKQAHELKYWRGRVSRGRTQHTHYASFYTTFFGLVPAFYAGKRVLDVGCGPVAAWSGRTWRPSASGSISRSGLSQAGCSAHRMTYVAAPSHRIPFADGHFDVVCAFNSLDHVATSMAPSGSEAGDSRRRDLLLIVEVNHPPTATEPVALGWDVLDRSRMPSSSSARAATRSEITTFRAAEPRRPIRRRRSYRRPGIVTAR